MKNIDWKNLPFQYTKTDKNLRSVYENGKWSDLKVSDSDYVTIPIASTCLHYGQEVFEGLKAYRGKDGKIRLFRWEENSERMNYSAKGILMPEVPRELFKEAVFKTVMMNKDYVPPFGHGATLYIRPFLIGLGPEVGVRPAHKYMFIVFVTPVGPYFKTGFCPVDIMICRKFDRAAPKGTGSFKIGGNYAASLLSLKESYNKGFSTSLYLDSKENKYIDEAGPANFFGIKGNTYVTPKSGSILKSITNKSLMQLARDMGMNVEERKIEVEELSEFDEVGACGTAAIITPIRKIVDPEKNKIYEFGKNNEPGEVSSKLYYRLIAIQNGEEEDKFGWLTFLE